MTSRDMEQPKKSIEDSLADVVHSVDLLADKFRQFSGPKVTSQQYASLEDELSAIKLTLDDVTTRVRNRSRDDEIFSTMTSGICSTLDSCDYQSKEQSIRESELVEKLRAENLQLQDEIKELEQDLNKYTRDHGERVFDSSFSSQTISGDASNNSADLMQLTVELSRCKETLKAMKADRRKLRSDNLDLYLQMKQLFCTLSDKEAELRDFIRNYDQHKQDHLDAIKQLTTENKRIENEKKELTRQRREAFEQNLILKSQLEFREDQLIKLQQELRIQTSHQRSATLSNIVKGCLSEDSLRQLLPSSGAPVSHSTSRKDPTVFFNASSSSFGLGPEETYSSCADTLGQAACLVPSYQHIYQMENSPVMLPRTSSITEGQLEASREKALRNTRIHRNRPGSSNVLSQGQTCADGRDIQPASRAGQRTSLGITIQTPGTIDEVDSQANSPPPLPPVSSRLNFLTSDNYQEKLRTMEEARRLQVSQWRAHHVLAWLEVDMNMCNFGPACVDNIKSGKVLLGLSDAELDSALRLSSPLHRRKMRLAIEELRDPSSVQYPHASSMDHIWVSHEWIYSLGLSQYSQTFEAQLVDGRLLRVLSKKDFDKYLSVHRKFHQSSLQFGVELLHFFQFDKEALQERRAQSKLSNSDPIVWSNQQVIQWADRIDLQEYSVNLKESGVHGALMVFDSSFTADSLASILGIASSKSYVRRHLAEELEAIIRPARAALESSRLANKRNNSNFVRSFSPSGRYDDEPKDSSRSSGSSKRLSLRGSFGRAFGKKAVKDTPSYSNEGRESV